MNQIEQLEKDIARLKHQIQATQEQYAYLFDEPREPLVSPPTKRAKRFSILRFFAGTGRRNKAVYAN